MHAKRIFAARETSPLSAKENFQNTFQAGNAFKREHFLFTEIGNNSPRYKALVSWIMLNFRPVSTLEKAILYEKTLLSAIVSRPDAHRI